MQKDESHGIVQIGTIDQATSQRITMQSGLKCQKEIQGNRFDSVEAMSDFSSIQSYEKRAEVGLNDDGGSCFLGIEDIADYDLLNSIYHQEELRHLAHVDCLDDLFHDIVSPPLQTFGDDTALLSSTKSQDSRHVDSNAERSFTFPSASLEILKSYRSRSSAIHGKKFGGQFCDSEQWPESTSPLSINHIIELAAGNFIQFNSATTPDLTAINHPYASSFLGLRIEDVKDVQLVQDLLTCAEKVGNQQYICAGKLLEECSKLSFSKTSAIQRLVYYFTEALHEKIDRETGRFTGKNKKFSFHTVASSPAAVSFLKHTPFAQVSQFTCIQTIMDHVSLSTKVHIIDLELWCGIRIVLLMQALASRSECPIEHIRVTTVGTTSQFEEVYRRLKSMAESLKLNFSFHVVMLEDILNSRKNLFHLDPGEAVVLHAAYFLQTMIPKPHQLERLIRAVEQTKPRIVIIAESESNSNSPVFVNRFVEALFFYGAYFDSLEECLKNAASDREVVEAEILSPAIRNIVATDGEDRNIRYVTINIWKKFFSRLGMVEIEFSRPALCHASLTREKVNFGDSCTLGLNGNSLIIGWKGTPLTSLSAWRFHRRRPGKKD
ncbi:DELLA protein RGL1-like [Andrographis paniculata]|uniref:DELLA protein RGL1-like n=1 Tax=Andrographis paniculata TaxID=175694 RepID=UPI0021E7F444|nr:DELLA protein RGL1-like [Andrographis paniculata]